MQISFYHLTRLPVEKALPKLLEKAFQQDIRCVVQAPTLENVQHLNEVLWTYHPESFLPHGTAKEGMAEKQPIWIDISQDNVNNASLLVALHPTPFKEPSSFEKIIYMFDGNIKEDLENTRLLWKQYNTPAHTLAYWYQGMDGQWVQNRQSLYS